MATLEAPPPVDPPVQKSTSMRRDKPQESIRRASEMGALPYLPSVPTTEKGEHHAGT